MLNELIMELEYSCYDRDEFEGILKVVLSEFGLDVIKGSDCFIIYNLNNLRVESELDALLSNINKESYVCSFKTSNCKRVYKQDNELWEQDMILIDKIFLDEKYK